MKSNLRGANNEFINHTPKVRRNPGEGVFYSRNNSVAYTVMKNDPRMQVTDRNQSQTLDYHERRQMNETQRVPDQLEQI